MSVAPEPIHPVIWLQNADGGDGRQWCEDNVWDDGEATRYVRADAAPAEFEVARLALAPGDLLVVRVPSRLTMDAHERIKRYFADVLPEGVRPLVIDSGTELSVLSAPAVSAERAS